MKVKIYRNLHRDAFSVVDKATGKVAFYAETFGLADAVFRVQKGGRQTVLRENRKNVHAYVQGTLLWFCGADREGWVIGLTYHPKWLPLTALKDAHPGSDSFGAIVRRDRHGFQDVTYNPYKAGDFMSNGKPVKAAEEVVGFATGKIQAKGISK